MSLVYRIQSKQDRTRGCYDTGRELAVRPDVVERMHDVHGFSPGQENHPSPYSDKDIGRCANRGEYCGFDSAADLLQWFKGFIPDLLRAGYEIVALRDVTITAVGEFQVLFTFNT